MIQDMRNLTNFTNYIKKAHYGGEIINLRGATRNDVTDIMNIETSCFKLEICEKEEVFLERLKIFNEGFYVLEENDHVIGYISTEIWQYKENINDNYFELGHSIKDIHNPKGNELYISSMGILPNYRGKGLGKILFQEAITRILNQNTNIKSQILIVSEKWKEARKIYRNNNFCEIHKIIDFFLFNDNYKENAIVMRKF